MDDFPRVQRWLDSTPLDTNHEAKNLRPPDPILPALEYFLSLEGTPGFDGWLERLATEPVGPPNRNTRVVRWAALCAELGATCLPGRELGLPVLGFDQHSPRASRPGSNCDLVVEVEGRPAFCEVKRRSAEDLQTPPPLVRDRLLELDLPYSLSIELLDRDYDCEDLEENLQSMEEWLAFMHDPENRLLWWPGESAPPEFSTPSFRIGFHEKGEGRGLSEFFVPVTPADIRRWLLEPSTSTRDGSRMKPMVEQAREKGADFLMCRVEPGGPWVDLVQESFESVSPMTTRSFAVNAPRLHGLSGVVLFSRYDRFCIVHNEAGESVRLPS